MNPGLRGIKIGFKNVSVFCSKIPTAERRYLSQPPSGDGSYTIPPSGDGSYVRGNRIATFFALHFSPLLTTHILRSFAPLRLPDRKTFGTQRLGERRDFDGTWNVPTTVISGLLPRFAANSFCPSIFLPYRPRMCGSSTAWQR